MIFQRFYLITSDLEKCADYITFIDNGRIIKSSEKDAFLEAYRLVNRKDSQLAGLINTVTGKGCFVAELSPGALLHKRNEMITAQMLQANAYYKSFGLTLEEVCELLKKIN